jgi:RNase P subunit RPR2
MRSHQHDRRFTTEPPKPAPAAFCPRCATPLTYLHSHTGGVSDKYPEQWDYFTCEQCGGYRYRHRTRRLTPVIDIDD